MQLKANKNAFIEKLLGDRMSKSLEKINHVVWDLLDQDHLPASGSI